MNYDCKNLAEAILILHEKEREAAIETYPNLNKRDDSCSCFICSLARKVLADFVRGV